MKRNKRNQIQCSNCGKVLTSASMTDNDGKVASILRHSGFIIKYLLYYGDPHFHVFCSEECRKVYMRENITSEQKQDGDKAVESLKQRLEENKDKLADAIDRVVRAFRKIQSKQK